MPMIMTILSAVVWISSPVIFAPLPNIKLMKLDMNGFIDFIMAPLPVQTGGEEQALAATRQSITTIRRNYNQTQVEMGLPPSRDAGAAAKEPLNAGKEGDKDKQAAPLLQEQTGTVGDEGDGQEGATLKKPEEMRCLQEWAFTRELEENRNRPWGLKLFSCLVQTVVVFCLMLVVSANILDYLWVFLFCFSIRWVLVVFSLARDSNNLLQFFALIIWFLVPFIYTPMVANRGYTPWTECFVCMFVFQHILTMIRGWVLVLYCRKATGKNDKIVRFTHFFFMGSDYDIIAAMIVLGVNIVVTLILITIEGLACYCLDRGPHTWWLLNSNLATSVFKGKAFQPWLTASYREDYPDSSRARGNSGFFLQNSFRRPSTRD